MYYYKRHESVTWSNLFTLKHTWKYTQWVVAYNLSLKKKKKAFKQEFLLQKWRGKRWLRPWVMELNLFITRWLLLSEVSKQSLLFHLVSRGEHYLESRLCYSLNSRWDIIHLVHILWMEHGILQGSYSRSNTILTG